MNIGKSIKVGLAVKEVTRAELAESANVSVSFLSLVTNKKRDISISKLENIAGSLGYKVSEFIALGEE